MPRSKQASHHARDIHGHTRHWSELLVDLASFLPDQAPVTTFVSQNTLRFLEDQPFHEAMVRARRLIGTNGYLSFPEYIAMYRAGVIRDSDIAEGFLRSGFQLSSVPTGWSAIDWVRLFLLSEVPEYTRKARSWLVREQPPAGLKAHLPRIVWDKICALPWNLGGHSETCLDDLPLIELLARNESDLPWQRIRETIGPLCAMYLDRGSGDWSMPGRMDSFFAFALQILADRPTTQAWQADAGREAQFILNDGITAELFLDTLLTWQQADPAHHPSILKRSMMAHPGWAGMMWRLERYPAERAVPNQPVRLVDYLAIQLLLEKHLCLEAMGGASAMRSSGIALRADLTLAIEQSLHQFVGPTDDAWDLFYAIASDPERSLPLLDDHEPHALCAAVEGFTRDHRRIIWQESFEASYRNRVLSVISVRRQAPDPGPAARPEFQVMTCLDDREESFRRAVEEAYPAAETFGGPGFFGLPVRFTPIGQIITQDICPLHVKAVHHVREVPAEGRSHARFQQQQSFSRVMHRLDKASRTSVGGSLVAGLLGLLAYPALVVAFLLPHLGARLRAAIARASRSFVKTDFEMKADSEEGAFSIADQAERVHALMVNIGMTGPFSRIVVFLGHGSTSVNNPHKSAYDCGACGGNEGVANARLLARLANSTVIRIELAKRGIKIPSDTWFLGGMHDTCNESIIIEDLDIVPRWAVGMVNQVQAKLNHCVRINSVERCRRFHSAPFLPTPDAALRHVQSRSADLGQPRPEVGHANNAMAVFGPRQWTRGVFLDRRSFLISYNPQSDQEGIYIERMLAGIMPVISGINLQYYFSRVDNDRLGCGTKLPHNPVGLFGVQEGATGDLRTGLPRQTVEIHHPLRLMVLVASTPEILIRIIEKQPEVGRVVRNGWVRLVCMDFRDGSTHLYQESQGFVTTMLDTEPVPANKGLKRSEEWYGGHMNNLDPVLVGPGPCVVSNGTGNKEAFHAI